MSKMSDEKEFTCSFCGFSMKYNYFGKKPRFAKSIELLEESFVMKDPFSSESGAVIILGSNCSQCQKTICAAQSCSLFYTRRFCLRCVTERLEDFPTQIQQEVAKRIEQKLS